MLFKNAIIFQIDTTPRSAEAIRDALAKFEFTTCGPTQQSSGGFTPPRGPGNDLAEVKGTDVLLAHTIQTRTVPAAALRDAADARCRQIERETGRKPGRREKKELKEDVLYELLPQAFPRTTTVAVWLDAERHRLVIDTASMTRADAVITALVNALDVAVTSLNTKTAPSALMSGWLAHGMDDDPEAHSFALGRDLELLATDESQAAVRYARHPLSIEDVRKRISDGMHPSRLALEFEDRVSFELTSVLALRKIKFQEMTSSENKEDQFDADQVINAAELGRIIDAPLRALGGLA